jgi:hypothetical protein
VRLGCYDAFRRLLRRLGTEGELARAPALSLAYRRQGGAVERLALPRALPAPLALPLALLRARLLPWRERLRAVAGLAAAARDPGDATVEAWLRRHRLDGGPRRWLFLPLCLAIMNAAPAAASARVFLAALRRAFAGRPSRAALWVPARPWRDIVGAAAERHLRAHGAEVSLGVGVTAIERWDGRVGAVRTTAGTRELAAGDLVVAALPWRILSGLLGDAAPRGPAMEDLPIVSVYFAGVRGVDADDVECLVDGDPFHFLCRRAQEPADRVALLAGAAAHLEGCSPADVEARAREQLARYYPRAALDGARARVMKEPRATLLISPAVAAARPAPGLFPGFANLRLAGDFTATGLPCTLEGAAASAEAALADLGERRV